MCKSYQNKNIEMSLFDDQLADSHEPPPPLTAEIHQLITKKVLTFPKAACSLSTFSMEKRPRVGLANISYT